MGRGGVMGRGARWMSLVLVSASFVGSAAVPAAAADPTCYRPPVAGRIVEPFREPACHYCAGHRGVRFSVGVAGRGGERVMAVAGGAVTFAGVVAGVRYVVVQHDDGRRATYGDLAVMRVRSGQRVVAGQALATTSRDGLYFGLRAGERYIDPEPLLGRWRHPVRLVPIDRGPQPQVPGRLVCPLTSGSR